MQASQGGYVTDTVYHTPSPPHDAAVERQACCVSGLAATRDGAPLRRCWVHGGIDGGCRRVVSSPRTEQ